MLRGPKEHHLDQIDPNTRLDPTIESIGASDRVQIIGLKIPKRQEQIAMQNERKTTKQKSKTHQEITAHDEDQSSKT